MTKQQIIDALNELTDDPNEEIFAFWVYFQTQAETETARQQLKYAEQKLQNVEIIERLTEIKTEHCLLDKLLKELDLSDDQYKVKGTVIKIANYIVYGKMSDV